MTKKFLTKKWETVTDGQTDGRHNAHNRVFFLQTGNTLKNVIMAESDLHEPHRSTGLS